MTEATRDFYDAAKTEHMVTADPTDLVAAAAFAKDALLPLWVASSRVFDTGLLLSIDPSLIADTPHGLDGLAVELRGRWQHGRDASMPLTGVLVVDGVGPLLLSPAFAEAAAAVAQHPGRYGLGIIYRP